MSKIISTSGMSNDQKLQFFLARWNARTDLVWLCNNVLNFPDVCWKVQGAFIRHLQKFPLPPQDTWTKCDYVLGGQIQYSPLTRLYELSGHRRTLILDPRAWLKSSSNAIAHTIQWILNYPNITILVVQSTLSKAQELLKAIRDQFRFNPRLRELFPEHVPHKKINEWGTVDKFTTNARSVDFIRPESTVMSASIESGTTGFHFDVMKFSDIVEPENTKTPEQIESVIRTFSYMNNLTVRPDSWIDVEGTRYAPGDLYGKIIQNWRSTPEEYREWKIHVRGCYLRDKGGKPLDFSPDEMDLPYLLDPTEEKPKNDKVADLRKVSGWPERWPTWRLEQMRLDPVEGKTFSAQRENRAVADQMVIFPVNKFYPKLIAPEDLRKVPLVRYDISVDMAETVGDRSNYTAITVGGWSGAGKCYIVDIVHGKLQPLQIVEEVIRLTLQYRPMTVKIEDVNFTRGLMPTFHRMMQLRSLFLPIELLKRDNRTSKKERIKNTLQPWYIAGDIIFVDNLSALPHLKQELENFPTFEYDDILDTLADLFQNRTWFGRLTRREQYESDELRPIIEKEARRLLGLQTIDEILVQQDMVPQGNVAGW